MKDARDAASPPRTAERFAFYVDGFNVYHSLDQLAKPHLKWLSWRRLAARIIQNLRRPGVVARIVFCTAPPAHRRAGALERHRRYVEALKAEGVVVAEGYFLKEDVTCRGCGASWPKHHEKEGDVALALALIDDAYRDAFDTACLVTNDGDQVPTVRLFKDRFAGLGKRLISIAPDWQDRGISRVLAGTADQSFRISAEMVSQSLLPKRLYRMEGDRVAQVIERPAEYDPPR